jgi:prepilin-type N-terminal cleavage/methylation domain-containing protein
MRDRRGFTLLELLMVVIIIAILASIALPQYFRVAERTRSGEAAQVLATIRGAQLRFKAQNAANLYADTAGLAGLDVIAPAMQSWNAPTVTGTGNGGDLSVTRTAGVHLGVALRMDMNSGTICSPNAAAAADWGIQNVADCP